MSIDNQFEQAELDVKTLTKRPTDLQLLDLYALFKQATEGDVNIEKPTNFFDFPGIAKFNAWESLKGTAKEVAEQISKKMGMNA